MSNFAEFTFRGQSGYSEPKAREIITSAIPVRTIAIYCFDPRAAGAAQAVADYFGDEVYPGDLVLDESGRKTGSTATVFHTNSTPTSRRCTTGTASPSPTSKSRSTTT